MKHFTKNLSKKKKSILSIALASILTLSFNYSPITLVSNWIKSASAYKSSSLQTYYANPTTESESKVGSGNYPTALKEFFASSSNNFNIQSYYTSRFTDLFGAKVHEYLSNSKPGNAEYKQSYESFLESKSKDNLLDYYESDKTYIKTTYSCSTFVEYVEYFISHESEWRITTDNRGTVPALFTTSNYRSEFYTALAYFLDDSNPMSVPDSPDGKYDGLPDDMEPADFYDHSISYGNLKEYIDEIIVKTVAIYSYDGQTQNNNVAGIIANNAPITSNFYYKDSTYETQNIPKVDYTTKSINVSNTTIKRNEIYYFGTSSDISSFDAYRDFSDFFVFDNTDYDKNALLFRQITLGEDGYIDENHPTYYRYNTNPFVTTNEKYELFVYDNDGVTDAEQATYDSLFMTVITQADIDADEANAEALKSSSLYSNKSYADLRYYVKVPFSSALNGDKYFKLLTSNYSSASYQYFCEYFAPDGNSRLYLKLKNNENYLVYIDANENDGTNASEFKTSNTTYNYQVIDVDFSAPGVDKNDFFEITVSYSSYYRTNYKLYFQKSKVFYNELVTDDSVYQNGVYETIHTPYIPYEMATNTPDESYEIDSNGRVIYALSDEATITIGGITYNTVSQTALDNEINRNFYVEVPTVVYKSIYGDDEQTNKLFYKHKVATDKKQIYILDDTDGAKDNEVYKNLNYKVITSDEYKTNSAFKSFVEVPSTDANYNKSFKLYYKYATEFNEKDIYVQNALRNGNAVYIVDDSLTYSDKTAYALNLFTVLTSDEFNANKDFFVQISENDSNYSTLYTKLYYKYNINEHSDKNVVYLYSSSSSNTYKTFYHTNSGYQPSDYKLVEPTDPDYVEGLELYYKKVRTEQYKNITQSTYYYYKTTSAVSLSVNSYYAISFYVNTTGENVEASLYITDSNSVMSDINIEHISTNGEWKKFVAFVATDALSASSISISMYMGDKNSILGSQFGNNAITSLSGSVLFDDIKITTINQTDYVKKSIDDVVVPATEEHKDNTTNDVISTIDISIVNDEFPSNTYDYRTRSNVAVNVASSWDSMFNFDNETLTTLINDTKLTEITDETDGFATYSDIWQYYISRDVSGQGNDFVLSQYQDAYIGGDLIASIIKESTIDKTVKVDEEDEEESDDDKKEDDKKEEDNDVLTIPSTFKNDNSVLKLENKNRLVSLGIASNYFEIRQFEYYKITVWIYSPDKESSATISVNSIMQTASTPTYGSVLSATANVDACLQSYSTKPTNEYSWIPVTFYIEGNGLHDQTCSLVLTADKNSTVYFDNITIENISSSAYDTASSDSDSKTQCLSLTPSSSVITNGITNGYFNTITLKTDYLAPSVSAPKAAKSWTANSNNSSNVIAGVVPTSSSYTTKPNNFYDLYNNSRVPYSESFTESNSYNNVFAIYAPSTMDSSIKNAYEFGVPTTNSYRIYSSSVSLSASSVYDVSFDFQKGNLKGNVIANLYYGSVDANKIISQIVIDADTIPANVWNEYHFYVATSTSSATIYLEIGVENATGTCFFKNASALTTTKTLDELRNSHISDADNSASTNTNFFEKDSLKGIKFINFANPTFSIHGNKIDEETNTYPSIENTTSLSNTKNYSVGKFGVAVASYYDDNETTKTTTYSVTIDKVTYYIGAVEEDSNTVYKLYKYSDCLAEDEVTEIGGLPVTVESYKKVIVGLDDNTDEYTSTSSDKYTYVYTFEDDVTINNVNIPASELKNAQSENVLILANSYSTDYTLTTPTYTSTLAKTSFYVLKIYVKTSNFDNEDFGLNINVSSISTKWENINTTTANEESVDEYGFVCYQALIKTSDASITSFGVTFSLGNEKSTGSGYAIISGVFLETFANEETLDHYASTIEDNEDVVKKYYANSSSSSSNSSGNDEDEDGLSWATFFYVFSSLLLFITLVAALVAVIIKKHPIKTSKKVENEHSKDFNPIQTTSKKVDAKTAKSNKDDTDESSGIV